MAWPLSYAYTSGVDKRKWEVLVLIANRLATAPPLFLDAATHDARTHARTHKCWPHAIFLITTASMPVVVDVVASGHPKRLCNDHAHEALI